MKLIRRFMTSVGLGLAAVAIFAAAAQARPAPPERRTNCVHLPRPWRCIDVQPVSRGEALHAVLPLLQHRAPRVR